MPGLVYKVRKMENKKLLESLKSLLNPGASVYVSGSASEPGGVISLIEKNQACFKDIHWIQFPLGGINKMDLSLLGEGSSLKTFFMSPFLKEGVANRRVSFMPMHMRNIFDFLTNADLDVGIFQAARDREGVLRYGPNVDFLDAVKRSAKHLIIEENCSFVAPMTAPKVETDRVTLTIQSKSGKPVYPLAEIDKSSQKIGRIVAELISDGDCLQTGIGAVPSAILANLKNHSDLGFHGGLLDDAVMDLIELGVVNGSRKEIDRGEHIIGMALGSEKMLNWLAANRKAENVVFKSANYTHDINIISRLENFVSINSAVQVDLFGQVNAEMVGARQISGTGGSVDFMRSASASRGGRSIVALTASAKDGKISKIVPKVDFVTALRTDVDTIVTEYGVAEIKNCSLEERANKLIEIADPLHREELRKSVNLF